MQALYEDNPREYLRLVGTALGRLAYEAEADLVWTYLTQADLREAGVHPSDTDDLIDVIRTARDVDVAALVKQQKDGRFKVSVRSRGGHDLAAVAAAFGGGGHRLAAGLHARPTVPPRRSALLIGGAEGRAGRAVTRPDGLLLVDKPPGITSHDAVATVRRRPGTKKVGHAGTLDPMATGLLVMGVGRATRLLRFLGDLPKVYEGTMRLGVETTTLDADGEVTRETDVDGDRGGDPRGDGRARRRLDAGPARVLRGEGGRHEALRRGPQGARRWRRPRARSTCAAFDLLGVRRARRRVPGRLRRAARTCGCWRPTWGPRSGAAPTSRPSAGPRSVRSTSPRQARPTPRSRRCRSSARSTTSLGSTSSPRRRWPPATARILGPAGIDGPYGVFAPDGRPIGVWEDEGTKGRPLVVLPPLDA